MSLVSCTTPSNCTFVPQILEFPYDGPSIPYHSGIAVVDLNDDEELDILFSTGRHDIREPYALINLSIDPDDDNMIIWSDPVIIGPSGRNGGGTSDEPEVGGRYTQVDTFLGLSSLSEPEVAVLLVGGSASDSDLYNTSSVLGGVTVTGCPQNCQATWNQLWNDTSPQGDRNGALASTITNGITADPAIVLTGEGGVAVFLPLENGTYAEDPAFVLPVTNFTDDHINTDRAQALDVGFVGNLPGMIVGAKTFDNGSPAPPLLTIVQNIDDRQSFKKFTINDGDTYSGDDSLAIIPNGVALGDWDGDGLTDFAATSFVKGRDLVDGYEDLSQWHYLVQKPWPCKNDSKFRTESDKEKQDNKNCRWVAKKSKYKKRCKGKGKTGKPRTEEIDAVDACPKACKNCPIKAPSMKRNEASSYESGGRAIASGVLFSDNNSLPDIVIGYDDDTIHFLSNKGIDGKIFSGFEVREVYQLEYGCSIRDLQIVELKICYKSVIGACSNGANFILHSTVSHCETEQS